MKSAADIAGALVADLLKDGARNAAEILTAAEGANISERTIQRAAISLGVVKTKAGFAGGWIWRLPADDGGGEDMPTAQAPRMSWNVMVPAEPQQSGILGFDGVPASIEHAEPVKDSVASEPSRAQVIAARLRKLEAGRGKVAPMYASDPRVMRWAQSGISDSDLREVYERAVFDMERDKKQGPVTAGILDPYV